jgi:hypothetical protein
MEKYWLPLVLVFIIATHAEVFVYKEIEKRKEGMRGRVEK